MVKRPLSINTLLNDEVKNIYKKRNVKINTFDETF